MAGVAEVVSKQWQNLSSCPGLFYRCCATVQHGVPTTLSTPPSAPPAVCALTAVIPYCIQGTRTLKTTSPFAKDTNFSKPIGEYSKVVIDE